MGSKITTNFLHNVLLTRSQFTILKVFSLKTENLRKTFFEFDDAANNLKNLI